MYSIALCDDETAELRKTRQMLGSYEKEHAGIDFEIECFESAEDLLYMVREKNYLPDLMVLDIYMPEKMGIEAAKELRDMGNRSRILFLTTSKEHALEAFGVEAVQYLVKPISGDVFFPILDRILEEIEQARRKYVLLQIGGQVRRVALSDIAYCEAQRKTQYLYLEDGTQFVLHRTLTELYEMLSRYPEFVRVGGAYIVNLEHVEGLNSRELQMDGGRKIYLPRGSYQSIREKYFDYYCGEA